MNKLITLKGRRNGALIWEMDGKECELTLADLMASLQTQGALDIQHAGKITHIKSVGEIHSFIVDTLSADLPR